MGKQFEREQLGVVKAQRKTYGLVKVCGVTDEGEQEKTYRGERKGEAPKQACSRNA